MTQYAKFISETEIEYPQASDFPGVPHWDTHDLALRRKKFVPLENVPEDREGFQTVLDRFSFTEQKKTRVEPRQKTVDIMEKDEETGEMKKVGEQTIMEDTEIEFDDSYITVLEYHYEELPPPPEPEHPVDVSEQLQQVIQLIMHYCDIYGATEELLGLDEINIESLTALIEKYEVTPEDKSLIMTQVLMIVLDLMGKLDETWYAIWNERVKPAINDILQQRRSQSNQ